LLESQTMLSEAFIQNTFLCFGVPDETAVRRRAVSIPPGHRFHYVDVDIKEAPPSSATTASPCPSEVSMLSEEVVAATPGQVLARMLAQPTRQGTSLIVQNIPKTWTQAELHAVWVEMGFDRDLNLFHLPIDYRKRRNLGFCLVHLSSEEVAEHFHATVEGKVLNCKKGPKSLHIVPARTQGFAENFWSLVGSIERGGEAAMANLPVVVDSETGMSIPFPVSRDEVTERLAIA